MSFTCLYCGYNNYNIEGINRHANDLISVSTWRLDMQALPYNPILIYKEQGRPQPYNLDNLADYDFLLCIQTEFQRDKLKVYDVTNWCHFAYSHFAY